MSLPDIPALSVADLFALIERVKEIMPTAESRLVIYQRWIQANGSNPLLYAVYYNYAALLSDSGDSALAEEAYTQTLNLKPDFIEARLNLGLALERQGKREEALAQWRQALAMTSADAPQGEQVSLKIFALKQLGRVLEDMYRYAEAEAYLHQALLTDGSLEDVMQHYLSLRQKLCLWPIIPDLPTATQTELRAGMSALALLAYTNDPLEQLTCAHKLLKNRFSLEVGQKLCQKGQDYGHDKLRIGYLSSDLCMHAVSLLTVQMFEHYDRERFEVYAFSWSKEDGSSILTRIKAGVTEYIPIHHLSDAQAAQAIRDKEIDILVDLQGLTSGARATILSYRPAPYCITYLGFPGPVGHPEVDYVLSDRFLITPAMEAYFVERPLHLPTVFQISDDGRPVAEGLTRAEYGLPEHQLIFCAFSNTYKVTPELFAVWLRILQAVPNSVLWMLEDNAWSKENLLAFARLHHINTDRIVFAPRETPERYLARYALADLFLDSFPFNGGTTANDALFMNLPILTRSGQTFASRMAGALLHALGFDELIVDNFNQYEAKAISLGLDLATLRAYPQRVATAKKATGAFNSKQVLNDIETAFWQLVKRS